MMKPTPTLQDIAEACGVTKTTVSLALRNHPRISIKTRKRVLERADRLGYRLNPLVSAHMSHLRNTRAPRYQATLGFVSNWPRETLHDPRSHIARYLRGVRERAGDLGYVVDAFTLGEDGLTEKRLDAMLSARGITGLIIAPLATAEGRLDLAWEHYAPVALGYSMRQPDIDRVCHDNYTTMLRTLANLDGLGYRTVGLTVTPEDDARVKNLWLAAYLVHSQTRQRPTAVPPCVTPRSGPKVFLDWFREHRPEVVISTSPQPSEWLLQAGEHVPETVGFATVAASDEKISGFDQNFELIGKAAVDKTTAMVQRYDIGIPESPRIMLIEGRWIDGHTLRPKADATPAAPVQRTRSKRRIKATA